MTWLHLNMLSWKTKWFTDNGEGGPKWEKEYKWEEWSIVPMATMSPVSLFDVHWISCELNCLPCPIKSNLINRDKVSRQRWYTKYITKSTIINVERTLPTYYHNNVVSHQDVWCRRSLKRWENILRRCHMVCCPRFQHGQNHEATLRNWFVSYLMVSGRA